MSTIVYKGVRFHCEPGVNILVHNDRLEVIDSAPSFNKKKVKTTTREPMKSSSGTVSSLLRDGLTKVGATIEVKSKSDRAIRSFVGRMGWSSSVKKIRDGVFQVTRNA